MSKHFTKISRKVGQTLKRHKMLEADDHVLIGLSGGKDSYILMETMADRKIHLPMDFRISAAHIKVKNIPYQYNLEYMKELCDLNRIPLIIKEIEIDLEKDPKKGTCFICSWHRRKMLFDLTKELSCNKLALGHHLDDAVETFLMNLVHHGSISGLPYTLKMFGGRVHLIRPLLNLREKELAEFAALRDYPDELEPCPYDGYTARERMKSIINQMEEINPHAVLHILRAPDKFFPEYLPSQKND